jgi:NhaP-type Na+/H+ and K+/H+ antiporter
MQIGTESLDNMLLRVTLCLSETIIIRNRTVYNITNMVSEISGFADLFIVFTSFILGLLYTPIKLKSELLKHMGPVE